MFIRTVKVPSSSGAVNEYVRIVEAYRDNGKVKQRVVADLGRKDVLTRLLPNLQRVLLGTPIPIGEDADAIEVVDASTWGPVLAVRTLFEELGLWAIFDALLPRTKKGPSFAERAFVLLANRLIRPTSEHGLARWLETDFVCDRQGRRFVPHWQRKGRVQVHHRQLGAWYRTLDVLFKAKDKIEVALYHRLRDLFSLKPDLVLYDITSTYFEGAGPADFAKHGYSRDGKPQNVQVVVGMVMVAGWPIAHHVWAGNRIDATTVQEVVADLRTRFAFGRVVFVGDRGMVSDDNIDALARDGHGYLVGMKRRRNAELDGWLQMVDEAKWLDCPVGITAREKKQNPPRTRVQEIVLSAATDVAAEAEAAEAEAEEAEAEEAEAEEAEAEEAEAATEAAAATAGAVAVASPRRVFVIDSDERRSYEQAKRTQAMERTRVKLESVRRRVADGELTDAARIGAAAERALRAHKGYRYFAWTLRDGVFEFFEEPVQFEREKRLEGRYVISTTETSLSALDAVALYKQLTEVERGFRRMKDVLSMRPVYHQVEPRVRAHIFVAALGLLLQTLLQKRLDAAAVELSAEQALQALETVRHVRFAIGGESRTGVSASNPRARQVLHALAITNVRPPNPPIGDLTVM
jgi:transposase